MPGESLSFDITANDRASSKFRDVGRAAADASVKMDLAAASLKVFDDSAAKAGKAAATSQKAFEQHAKAAKLLADTENVLAGRTTQYTKLLVDQSKKENEAGKSAQGLAARFSALAGAGGAPGGMGALVAAGAALSPVLITLGTGLAGLAAAAYGIAKPIENAAQKTGGLQANLSKLDPEQRTVATGILRLGRSYNEFQASLKPEVLSLFNTGLSIAGHLLHDVQPVAKATGIALNSVLGSVDREFQSGTWQQFFAFMARTAGPDMQLLGRNLTDLLQLIPPLTEDLQPLAQGLLRVSDGAVQAAGGITHFYDSFQRNVPVSNQNTINFLKDLDRWTVDLTNHIPGAQAVNNWLTGVQKGLTGTGTAAAKARPPVKLYADAADQAAAAAAHDQAIYVQEAHALNILAAQYEHALTPLENYIGAQIAERDDLKALNDALKISHDRIGLKTAAERASFSAAQTYINQTIQQGNAALAAHKGIDAQISSIEHALPRLESVRGKTAAYKQELDLLKGILDKLRAEKFVKEFVTVTGTGSWRLSNITTTGPQGQGVGRAAGGLITGGAAGRDSVPIMAMPGEVVVPTGMVRAGAVDHLRGSLPGFAAGGIVGSYSGPVAGLPPWTSHNQRATLTAIGADIGHAMASALRSLSAGGGVPGLGVAPTGPLQNYAKSLLAAYGWANQWTAFNDVVMRESGWNVYAQNPSSGAYGIPQALPGSKMAAAGADWRTDGFTQLRWMMAYIASRYGSPNAAWAHEVSAGWYDRGGYLPVGWSLALNTTGRPEPVTPHGRGTGQQVNNYVTVQVGHGTHPVAAAQEIAKLLNQGARSGVKLRTSILGPG